MFPCPSCAGARPHSLPRIRGGVSVCSCHIRQLRRSSPHTRGCFQALSRGPHCRVVFPAYAGVFLGSEFSVWRRSSLPRIRGGVSNVHDRISATETSSPHTRGCFSISPCHSHMYPVFPAYAGVFLLHRRRLLDRLRLPRIRGGVSPSFDTKCQQSKSSPHTRGCFPLHRDYEHGERVFPAYAGVFLQSSHYWMLKKSLPRIRGGVSVGGKDRFTPVESSPHTRGCFSILSSLAL